MCDRALLIDQGKVLADGTISQLIELGGHRPRMEMVFNKFPSSGWYEGIAGVVRLAPAIDEAKVILELSSLRQVSEILECAYSCHGQLLEFAVHSPNLSDAFISLTGHELRETTAQA